VNPRRQLRPRRSQSVWRKPSVHVENFACQIDEQHSDEICRDESSQSCVEPINHGLPIVMRSEKGKLRLTQINHDVNINFCFARLVCVAGPGGSFSCRYRVIVAQ
jgi:hypothetical protein